MSIALLFLAQAVSGSPVARPAPPPATPSQWTFLSRPGRGAAAIAHIDAACGGIADKRTVAELLRMERETGDSLLWRDGGPRAYGSLACIRLRLMQLSAFPRAGFQMFEGFSWLQGTFNVLIDGLRRRPGDAFTADMLALSSLLVTRPFHLNDIARGLSGVLPHGVRTGPALRGCSDLAYRTGDTTSSRQCAEAGLATGQDSTWHLIRLARLALDAADTTTGARLFLAASATARDSAARGEMTWHLQWFLSTSELEEWRTIAANDAPAKLLEWFTLRDVRNGQRPNARIAEHFARLRYVEKHFWLNLGTITAATEADAMLRRIPVAARSFVRWQNEFDDRGAVWLRFGAPARDWGYGSANASTGVWYYDFRGLDDSVVFRSVLHSGSAEATRLVSGTMMRLMTETDDNSVRGDRTLRMAAQFYRIWDPVTREPFLLVGYGIQAGDLLRNPTPDEPTEVHLTLQQWDEVLRQRSDTTMSRGARLPSRVPANLLFAGVFAASTSAGVSNWSLVADQGPGFVGHDWVATPPLPPGDLRASDLILGAPSQNVAWRRGSEVITLAPSGSLDRTKPVILYYQRISERAIDNVSTTIAVHDGTGPVDPGARPRLQFAMQERIPAGYSTVTRDLDLSSILPGNYRFEITVTDSAGKVLLHRITRMPLR